MRKSSASEGNSVYNIIDKYRLLFIKNRSNPPADLDHTRKILSTGKDIFGNESNAQVFAYLSQNGAATAWILQVQLGMPEATVYRVLKFFRAKRYIVPALKVSKHKYSKGGPRATVWALENASNEDRAAALRLHYHCLAQKCEELPDNTIQYKRDISLSIYHTQRGCG